MLVHLGDVAAEDHDARVEEVDAAREDLAERPPGLAHDADRLGVAGADELHDAAAALGGVAGGGEPLGQRVAAGDRLQAADVPAAADHVLVVADDDVADVARRAVRAAVDLAPGDDAAADAGADLDVEEVRDVAPVGPVLAEGHDVDVVVDEDRQRAEAVGEPARDGEPVPAGHDRRADGPA